MCSKCEGQVRYDAVNKVLKYKSGCDWLTIPMDGLTGAGGSTVDTPSIPPGEAVPPLPDGDENQLYACRKAVAAMELVYTEGANIKAALDDKSLSDFLDFIIPSFGTVLTAMKYAQWLYNTITGNESAFEELLSDTDGKNDFVCALNPKMTNSPTPSQTDYDAAKNHIKSFAENSPERVLFEAAFKRINRQSFDWYLAQQALNTGVDCPCGASSPNTPPGAPPPGASGWCRKIDLKLTQGTGEGLVGIFQNPTEGIYEQGVGIKDNFINGDRNFIGIALPEMSSVPFILRIDLKFTGVTKGTFNNAQNTPNNEREIFSTWLMFGSNFQSLKPQINGWMSFDIGSNQQFISFRTLFAYNEQGLPNFVQGHGRLEQIVIYGTGTPPDVLSVANGWTDCAT